MEFESAIKKRIHYYLHLDQEINRVQQAIEEIRTIFYSHSFHDRTAFTGTDQTFIPSRFENRVIDLVDGLASCEDKVKRLIKKREYALNYLKELPEDHKRTLMNEYKKPLEDIRLNNIALAFYEEMKEIEEFIHHRLGIPADKTTSHLELNNENLECDFENILEILEV